MATIIPSFFHNLFSALQACLFYVGGRGGLEIADFGGFRSEMDKM
jgi:hypothetical protein